MSLSFRVERRLSEIRKPKVPPPGQEGCPLPLSPQQAQGETWERVEPTAAPAACGWARPEGLILQSQDPGGPPVLKQTLLGKRQGAARLVGTGGSGASVLAPPSLRSVS